MSTALKELYLKFYPEGKYQCPRCKRSNEAGEEFKYYSFSGHHCPNCYKYLEDKKKEERREEIRSGDRDTDNEDEITCPYCGYEFSDSWEFLHGNDGELGEIDCHDCCKTFTCAASFSVSYSTQKIDEDNDEES